MAIQGAIGGWKGGERIQAVCPRCCASSVCADCIDIDSMRKMALELATGKDGKQGGCRGKWISPRSSPPCPGTSDRECPKGPVDRNG